VVVQRRAAAYPGERGEEAQGAADAWRRQNGGGGVAAEGRRRAWWRLNSEGRGAQYYGNL